MPSVLIVDDLPSFHEMLDVVVQPIGFTTAFATDGASALERYKQERFDLVLADFQMSPMNGITLLREIKKIDPKAVVIIMTAHADTSNAMDALKFGAFDYLQKPFKVDELVRALRRALEHRQGGGRRARKPMVTAPTPTTPVATEDSATAGESADLFLLGESRRIKRIAQQVRKLVSSKTPVLLTGEPGTGKKTIAEFIHTRGAPAGSPLVRFDCAIVAEPDLVAGLIGPQGQGGAWIEQARGGTLFLENIDALPLPLQKGFASVLRAAGSSFRLVCSSKEDLERLVEQGRFNEEFFFRVAALPVALPPLRERTEDFPVLVKAIAQTAPNPRFCAGQVEFSDDALAVLAAHRWPGNLAELTQVITRVVAETESRVIDLDQLPPRLRELKDFPSLADYLAGQEKHYIERVLQACRGDREAALKVLRCDPAKLG